ncbi:hypothetical protein NP233_g12571 [Leucocoprinus birnbaumii]|uniref:BAH domain-containing protein n=1 Tax=Leucocoprinus birnbaumii TaxID=56174 RepID=A0AAD5VJU5_9AGAR|nr:hypothetical protein NP233_g12571 [Leucocoprinus birnbaumii]
MYVLRGLINRLQANIFARLFVVGPGTQRGPELHHAQTYWKVYVHAIYIGISQAQPEWHDKIFLHCDYLYGKRDFGAVRLRAPDIKAEIVERLGEMELVMSDVPAIIHGSTVEDKCELYRFESHCLDEPDIPPGSWYFRYELDYEKDNKNVVHGKIKDLNPTLCKCGKTYNPNTERQVYCLSCKRWAHIECCKENGPRFHNSKDTMTFANKLACAPRTRGITDAEDPDDWTLVGSGRRLGEYCTWLKSNPNAEEDDVKEYFESNFGEQFYHALMTDLELPGMCCPRCERAL